MDDFDTRIHNALTDEHSAVLLNACGYSQEFHEESWQDVGGPESGPDVVGHPAHCVWTLPLDGKNIHVVVAFARDPDVMSLHDYMFDSDFPGL
jgi:hypothetical protein